MCNFKGPICSWKSFQCYLASACINRGGSLLDLGLNKNGAGTKYITEKQKHHWVHVRLPVRSLYFCTSEATSLILSRLVLSTSKKTDLCKHLWLNQMSCLNVKKVHFILKTDAVGQLSSCSSCFFCIFAFLMSITNPENRILSFF